MSFHEPHPPAHRLSIPDVVALRRVRPIVALTAYTAPMARLLDTHVDVLLVGDSLGMVLYGRESTLSVTLDDMIRHTRCVVDASKRACVITDLPFGSYQASPAEAFASAARLMAEGGAQGVKLEGGVEMAETVTFLRERGIPVMAHLGLRPQHLHLMGGYRTQGKDDASRKTALADAAALERAGAFCLLLEGMERTLAAEITGRSGVPTIGIGAGSVCDGQILVTEDMLGISERTPRFVKRFAEIGQEMERAAAEYARAVTEGRFPAEENSYSM